MARYLPKFVITKAYGSSERSSNSVQTALTVKLRQSSPCRFTDPLFRQMNVAKGNFWMSCHQIATLAREEQRWSLSDHAVTDFQFVGKRDRAEDLEFRNAEASLADE
jgi:hypothetical protein